MVPSGTIVIPSANCVAIFPGPTTPQRITGRSSRAAAQRWGSKTLATLGHAQVGWLVAALLMSAGTYVAAAVAQLGTVTMALPLGRTVSAQVASTFANRFTPAGLGANGISVRYLERSGLSRSEAVGASASGTLAGLLVHVLMLVVAGFVVGRSQVPNVHLPEGWIALVAAVSVLALAGFAFGTVTGRRRLLAPIRRSLGALREVLRGQWGGRAVRSGAL
jgi:hypothetical protein